MTTNGSDAAAGFGTDGEVAVPVPTAREVLDHAAELILELEELADRWGFRDLATHLALAYAEACRNRRRLKDGT